MPEIIGYHHLNLTVTDATKSAEWWTKVLGFTVLREFEREGMTKVILRHPISGTLFGFTTHGPRASNDSFSEFRTGMDHVAFSVKDRAELEAWKRQFEEFGVDHSEIKASVTGDLIAFRDPDNIQCEVYADTPTNS
ncbi:MAG: VOC family protein [Actinomycetota bacterium]